MSSFQSSLWCTDEARCVVAVEVWLVKASCRIDVICSFLIIRFIKDYHSAFTCYCCPADMSDMTASPQRALWKWTWQRSLWRRWSWSSPSFLTSSLEATGNQRTANLAGRWAYRICDDYICKNMSNAENKSGPRWSQLMQICSYCNVCAVGGHPDSIQKPPWTSAHPLPTPHPHTAETATAVCLLRHRTGKVCQCSEWWDTVVHPQG